MFVPYIIFACIILFLHLLAPYRLRGSRNGALSILCSLVVKGVPKQGLVCFLVFVFCVHTLLCLIVFCQYQCNRLPGKTRLGMIYRYYVSSGCDSLPQTNMRLCELSVCNSRKEFQWKKPWKEVVMLASQHRLLSTRLVHRSPRTPGSVARCTVTHRLQVVSTPTTCPLKDTRCS